MKPDASLPSYGDFTNSSSPYIISLDDDLLKGRNEKRKVAEVKENWINKLIFGSTIAIVVNFTLLTLITIYFWWTFDEKMRDEKFYDQIFEPIFLTCLKQGFTIYLPLDALMHLMLIIILYPLSRINRSPKYYWFIGIMSAIMISCVAFFDFTFTWAHPMVRAGLSIEATRLSMKIVAFLFECASDEKVFDETGIASFIYFLCIPHLVYKSKYPVAKRRRWLRVLSHIWWLWVGAFPFGFFWFEHILPWITFDITQDFTSYLLFALRLGLIAITGYFTVVWFFFFANYLSLHAEILKFTDQRFMGGFTGFLKGVDVATELNTIASKWFARYCYVPILKSTKSRFLALCFAFVVSELYHELVFAYVFQQVCLIAIPCAIVAPLLLIQVKNDTLCVKVTACLVMFTLLPLWAILHPMEYMAWNYSNIPNIENESKWRLLPLFLTYNIDYHLKPWLQTFN